MEIYGIVIAYWDGWRYSHGNVRCFSTEEKRDAAKNELEQSDAFKKGDMDIETFENELDK